MKDVNVSLADPIEPVCPEDDRPAVKDLIKEHGAKIEKIRESLLDHPLYDVNKHDDLWILRFWLSHKKSQAATNAAKYTLEFRKTYNLDEKDIRSIPPHQVESGTLRDFTDSVKGALAFTHPNPRRGVIGYMKIANMNPDMMVERFTEDHWLEAFMYNSEWSFQTLDYVTRTTGRLTKSIRFIDLSGFKMSLYNREISRRDGKVMGIMEDCYPQLLEFVYVCNPPTFLNILWKLIRVVMPKRVINKFDIVIPKDRTSRKKFIRHISEEDLPDYYGGKNPMEPHSWKTNDGILLKSQG